MNATGDALLYSTYLGGSTTDTAQGVAVDAQGSLYVTGWTASANFPVTPGAFRTTTGTPMFMDGFVTKFSPAGNSLVYSTFLNASTQQSPFNTQAVAIAVDGADQAYVTGNGPVPTTSGAYQASLTSGVFVLALNAAGSSEVYAGYLTNAGNTTSKAIAVDEAGEVFVTGNSNASTFPTTTGAFQTTLTGTQDAFVSKWNAAGSGLVYSSYLGAGGAQTGNAIAVDSTGAAVVAGKAANAFVAQVNPAGSALTYDLALANLGATANGVALDVTGNAYVVGTGTYFTPPPGGTGIGPLGNMDVFVAKVGNGPPTPAFSAVSPDTGVSSSDQLTRAQNLTLSGSATPGSTVTVSRSDVGVLGTTTADPSTGLWSYSYASTTLPEGTYAFTATATSGTATSDPSAEFLVTVDLTPPAVTLSVPAQTTSRGPLVLVSASDLNGLPDGTPVAVDVDLNNDGNFTDPGETGYAAGALKGGFARITLPTLPGLGTYRLQARVSDLAGNPGASTVQTMQVAAVPNPTSPWQVASSQAASSDPQTGMAAEQLGNVAVTHALDLDQSPGTTQSGAPMLVYNSDSVSVRPIVQASIQSDNASALPATISAQLFWDGVAQTTQPVSFSTAGHAPGDVLTVAAQVAQPVTGTGRHGWQLIITVPGQTLPLVATGSAFVAAQDTSPFGAGWTFSGTDRLVVIPADANGPAGVLRVYGTGSWRFFQGTGPGAYTSPAGDNGTLVQNSDLTYTYTRPEGDQDRFDALGRQTAWVSADGHETLSYSYNGAGTTPTGMTAIDGAVTTFTYATGSVTIATAGPRTTTLTLTGGNLAQIQDPDGRVRSFGYDSSHRLTSEVYGPLANEWSYDPASGTLRTATWGNPQSPSISTYSPAVVQGLSSLVSGPIQATVTDALGRTTAWQLDSAGRPLLEQAADGGVWTWARDPNTTYVSAATDPLGRTTAYQRDAQGYVTRETLPDGNTRQYVYQAAFHALTSFTDERLQTTLYQYDAQGHLSKQTDPLQEATGYVWDPNTGLLQSLVDPMSRVTGYGYDAARRLTSVSDILGGTTLYVYDANGNPAKTVDAKLRSSYTTYDPLGRLLTATDAAGNAETWSYDGAGQLQKYTDKNGHSTLTLFDGAGRGLVTLTTEAQGTTVTRTTADSYDSAGQLSAARNADGYWTTYAYDPVGRTILVTNALGGTQESVYDRAGELTASRDEVGRWTQYVYNTRGWQTQLLDPAGNLWQTGFDPTGNVIAQTNPLGKSWTAGYDAVGRQTQQADPLAHGQTISYWSDGRVQTVTDPRGFVAATTYDFTNHQVTATLAQNTPHQEVIVSAFDLTSDTTSVTDGLNHATTYGYDALDRQTSVSDALGHSTSYGYDPAGDLTSTTDALHQTSTAQYDALEQPVGQTDANGNRSQQILDAQGQDVSDVDGLGHALRHVFDALGQEIYTVDALGAVTKRIYDGAGELLALTDANGNTTKDLYNRLGQVIQQTDPLGHSTAEAYDTAGRLTSLTDRLGRVRTFSYDDAGRLTVEVWKAANGTVVNTRSYSYDNASNLLTAGDNSGTYTYTYDELGRQATQTDLWGLTLTNSYDAANRLTQVQDSLGGARTFGYDNADRLTGLTLAQGGQAQLQLGLSYSDRDQLATQTRYGYVGGQAQLLGTTAYAYDNGGRLLSLAAKDAGGNLLDSLGYSYDAANRLTQETSTLGPTRTYSYDATDQLTGDGSSSYSYDRNGNRANAGYQTGAANELQTDGTWNYSYDAEGNLTQKVKIATGETWTYGYDTINELVWVEQRVSAGGTLLMRADYKYDVLGNRVEKDVTQNGTTTTTRFAYDGTQAWADLDGTSTLQMRHLFLPGATAPFARESAGGVVAWYVTDRLGSVRDMLDSTGALQDHRDFNGFGQVTAETNASFGDRYGFAGGEQDGETGLVHFGWRYYDPAVGRWNSQDPLGLTADVNPYRYTDNGPTNATDPSGQAAEDADNHLTGPPLTPAQFAALEEAERAERVVAARRHRETSAYAPRPSQALRPLPASPGISGLTPEEYRRAQQVTSQRELFEWVQLNGGPFFFVNNACGIALARPVLAPPLAPSAPPPGYVQAPSGRTTPVPEMEAPPRSPPPVAPVPAPVAPAPVVIPPAGQTLAPAQPVQAGPGRVPANPTNPYNISTTGMSAAERAAIIEYAQRTNAWLAQNGPATVQGTAGTLRSQASAATRAERLRAARAGQPYQGQAGHVPDTAISGQANPPAGWLDMPGTSNQAAGGGLSSRIGQTIDAITVDGRVP